MLNGRDAKIIVADYDFESQYLVYSTSEIFTHQTTGSQDVVVVYAYEGEDGEFAIKAGKDVQVNSTDSNVQSKVEDSILQINYQHPEGTIPIKVTFGDDSRKDLLILVSGYSAATRWWAPQVAGGQDKDTERVLIHGPYLVRKSELSGSTLHFYGDIDETTPVQVVAPDFVKKFRWNGNNLDLEKTSYGTWTGTISFEDPDIRITDLTQATWKYSPAYPESEADFDDSEWAAADHTTTNSITTPQTLPILFADDYGKHILF